MGYTNEFSNFPTNVITLHKYKDVDDNIASVINKINLLRGQGLYNQATRVIHDNNDVLKNYVFGANQINAIIEEIRNTQIYSREVQQSVFIQDEEPDGLNGDIWVGGV